MSVMDLSSTVASFYTGTYNVTRASGPGDYVDGVFIPTGTSVIPTSAMVAPINGRELQRLSEGLRTRELKQVFTIAELRVDAPGQRPDLVSIDGSSWQVEISERWAELGNFYRSVVSKVP